MDNSLVSTQLGAVHRRRVGLLVGRRQSLAAVVERVERRNVSERFPGFGLQVDRRPDLLEVTDHLQNVVDNEEQAENRLENYLKRERNLCEY